MSYPNFLLYIFWDLPRCSHEGCLPCPLITPSLKLQFHLITAIFFSSGSTFQKSYL